MSYVAISERAADGSEWRAVPDQYEALLHAFESGSPFLTFTNTDGADVMVRASDVVAIAFMSDATLQAQRERRANEALS